MISKLKRLLIYFLTLMQAEIHIQFFNTQFLATFMIMYGEIPQNNRIRYEAFATFSLYFEVE